MSATEESARLREGVLASLGAQLVWGLLPLYFKLVGFADVREILGVRILWAVPAVLVGVAALEGVRAGLAKVCAALTPRMLGMLSVSAALIFVNWSAYVWAVHADRVMEASFAYFVAPVVQLGVGIAFFKERARRGRVIAIALAVLGALLQGLALGAVPLAALAMTVSWCGYAVVRRLIPVPSAVGLLVETLALIPVALGLLWWVSQSAPLASLQSGGHFALLALSGPFTALPLVLFALGVRRIPFALTAMLQYLSPCLQFAIALYFGEPVNLLRAASFVVIWIALAAFTQDLLYAERVARRTPATPTPPAGTPG